MLESYFKYQGVLRRMRRGPLSGEIDAIARGLERTGYTRESSRRYLSLISSFSRYASNAGCIEAQKIDRPLVERFLSQFPRSATTLSVARSALGHVFHHVARRYPRPVCPSAGETPDERLLAGFDVHLRDIRGLTLKSCEELLRAARRTISWYRTVSPRKAVSRFRPKDVLAYAEYAAAQCVSQSTRSAVMSYLRGFLRYLHWSGTGLEDLSRYVPRVPIWRMAKIPDYLPWAEVLRVIDSIDVSEPAGKRPSKN